MQDPSVNSAPLGLLLGHLQPFLSPDPLHALVIYHPAVAMEQGSDAAIAIPAELLGIASDGSSQPYLAVRHSGLVTLRRPRLPNHPAETAFRHR
jgi:hypothetical protein